MTQNDVMLGTIIIMENDTLDDIYNQCINNIETYLKIPINEDFDWAVKQMVLHEIFASACANLAAKSYLQYMIMNRMKIIED